MTNPVLQIISDTQGGEQVAKKENCSHQADCMKMIQMAIDGEASPEQMQQVSQNLSKCLPCEKGYKLEQAIREALQLRMEKRCVPSTLIDCIKQKIGL